MNWIPTLILFVISIGCFIFGYSYKSRTFIFIGYVGLFIIGLGIVSTGLSIPSGWMVG
jgi:hypothetical protein